MKVIKSKGWFFCVKNQEIIHDDGHIIVLPTRIGLCLEALIEAAGETISYDELLQRVWKTEHRDSSTISSVISELRKQIAHNDNKTVFIKTVPKKGYRFVEPIIEMDLSVAEIEALKTGQKASELVSQETKTKLTPPVQEGRQTNLNIFTTTWDLFYPSKNRGVALVLLGIFIAISVSLGASRFNLTNPVSDMMNTTPIFDSYNILTYEPGLELEFDVSSDGLWLAYAHKETVTDPKKIVARNLVTNELYILGENDLDSYESPNFSPNAKSLVYVKNTTSTCEIRTIGFSKNGFEERSDKWISSCGLAGVWTTPAFSIDSEFLYFARSKSLTDPFKLYRHDLTTGYERQISSPETSGRGDYSFTLDPSGEHIAIVRNQHWSGSKIIVLDLKKDETQYVITLPHLIHRLDWIGNDTLIYKNSRKQLETYNFKTKVKLNVISSTEEFSHPVVKGKKVFAFKGKVVDAKIWQLWQASNGQYQTAEFITSPFSDYSPVYAEDLFFFISDRTGVNQIWVKKDKNLRQVSFFNKSFNLKNIVFSPKNNKIYGLANGLIFALSVENSDFQWLGKDNPNYRNLTLSDDQTRLIFGYEESERWFIESIDLVTGAVIRITPGFSAYLNNGILYYVKFREDGLWKLDTQSGEKIKILEKFKSLDSNLWIVQNDSLLFVDDKTVHAISLATTESIFQVEIARKARSVTCSNNLSTCFYDQYGSGETEIVELRKNKD
ncbi:winged helix-turn-helix domain-containing protein [Paraglaciecola sp.]|uniref:winged helix-turn-helix domain-containing protein n=1 Tax=Paraglaciecola sp. TaxID=1920173 RepID=UPI0030F48DC3